MRMILRWPRGNVALEECYTGGVNGLGAIAQSYEQARTRADRSPGIASVARWLCREFVVDRTLNLSKKFGRYLGDLVHCFRVLGSLGEDFLFGVRVGFEGAARHQIIAVKNFGHELVSWLGLEARRL
jgi:hypothetical protein